MNIGHSSRTLYDECAYQDRLEESTDPLLYRLDPNQISNCNECLSTLGPRSGAPRGTGVSTVNGSRVATSQSLVDVESILSNRNLPQNKCKIGEVNPIDVTKFRSNNLRVCNDFLNPLSSKLSYPTYNYREMAIDRFYDLNKNPQANIFWPYAVNTTLEAKDNFDAKIPNVKVYDQSQPREIRGTNPPCRMNCSGTTC